MSVDFRTRNRTDDEDIAIYAIHTPLNGAQFMLRKQTSTSSTSIRRGIPPKRNYRQDLMNFMPAQNSKLHCRHLASKLSQSVLGSLKRPTSPNLPCTIKTGTTTAVLAIWDGATHLRQLRPANGKLKSYPESAAPWEKYSKL